MCLTDLLGMLFQSALTLRLLVCFPMDYCQRAYKDQVTTIVFLLVSTCCSSVDCVGIPLRISSNCIQDHEIRPSSLSPISLDTDSTAPMILNNSQSFEIVHPSLISEYPAIIHSNCTIQSQFLLIKNPEFQHHARSRPKSKSACGCGGPKEGHNPSHPPPSPCRSH